MNSHVVHDCRSAAVLIWHFSLGTRARPHKLCQKTQPEAEPELIAMQHSARPCRRHGCKPLLLTACYSHSQGDEGSAIARRRVKRDLARGRRDNIKWLAWLRLQAR